MKHPMKCFSMLLLTLLLTSSMAAAQNTATVGQTGNGNDATVDQTVGSNTAEVTQNATLGNGNFADVLQNGGGHEAYINQIGDSDAEISQTGGTGNFADISQDGKFDRVLFSRNYYGIVTQVGSDNEALIEQVGSNGRVRITQTGDGNIGHHLQGTASYSKSYIHGLIEQDGNDNEAYQDKSSTAGVTGMDIQQLRGDRNWAKQDLSAAPGTGAFKNGHNLDILQQDGDDNYALQDVSDRQSPLSHAYNTLAITQTGSDNRAVQTSHDRDVTSTIDQTGDANVADVTFEAGVSRTSVVNITQEGNPLGANGLNDALVIMNGAGPVNITQYGDRNDADVTLNADGTVTIHQGDLLGLAFGSDNVATVTNATPGSTATVTQHGNNNTATVNQ